MDRSIRNRAGAVVITAFAALSCATPMTVRTDQSESADFSALRTYSWRGGDASAANFARDVANEDLDRWIRTAVDAELGAAGYERRADGGDFLLGYEVTIATQHRRQTVAVDSGGTARSVTVRYREGTLVLEAFLPGSEVPIWRGWAEAEVNRYLKPEAREARLGDAANRILKRFPSRQ
jgi:hypothetical protein